MSLLNKSNVRKRALAIAKERRGGKFSRVSEQFIVEVEAAVRNVVDDKVMRHPSKGKTLMGNS